MARELEPEEMKALGVQVSGKEMDNGELRFRMLVGKDSGYIWTQPPADQQPAWQNAHYYKGVYTTYVVERGKLVMAFLRNGQQILKVYTANEVVTTTPGEQHNAYLFADSAIHTVKHGTPIGNPDKKGNDWWDADPKFDQWTKSLTEDNVRRLCGS